MMMENDQPKRMKLDESAEFTDMVVIVSFRFLSKFRDFLNFSSISFPDRRHAHSVSQGNRLSLQHHHRLGHEDEHEGRHHRRVHNHIHNVTVDDVRFQNSRIYPKTRPGASIPPRHVRFVGSADYGAARLGHVPSRVRLSIESCQGHDR